MSDFQRLHAVIFDEVERQGLLTAGIDVGRLAEAVHRAQAAIAAAPLRVEPPNPRCASGACDG